MKLTGWWRFIVLVPVALAAAQAQIGQVHYEWDNIVIGDGGFIPGIVFSRAEPGLAYVRTDIGGAYRRDGESGRWIPLQDAMHQSNYFGIESIAPDPVDADVVYAAAGMYRRDGAAILRSRDRGATWDVFPVAFRMGGNEDGRGLGERLAIDPNERSTLYFGSRHDGLQQSVDAGARWQRVGAFPHHGLGAPARGQRTNGGLSFVVIDAGSGSSGKRSQTLFVGVADPGADHLYRSDDGGGTWKAVAGQPRSSLLPAQAELDARGTLYVTYSDRIGPSGVTDGLVFKYDTRNGTWTDITPPRTNEAREGGYMGISIDRQHDDTLVVATMNRYNRGDTIWRSTDAGESWHDIRTHSGRDVSATPFLLWGNEEADFGWWIAALAIDPFNSDFVAYGTGATIYATDELSNASEEKAVVWRPWVEGIEHTAIITLVSPTEGARLLSGFGDISGFAHRNLDVSPAAQFRNPVFANTNTIDYAGAAPNVIVRSGTPPHRATGGEPTFAWSTDYGTSWQPLQSPRLNDAVARASMARGDFAIAVSAEGGSFVVAAPRLMVTFDRGASWQEAEGSPYRARAVADRVKSRTFYALDFERSSVFLSTDGGQSFTSQKTRGLPDDITADRPMNRERPSALLAVPGGAEELWFVSRGRLFYSADAGRSFAQRGGCIKVEMLSFGKAPPGRDAPALFAIGEANGTRAIWRSDDSAETWLRLNDDRHEWGRRFRVIAGDPRIFGRVYVGTDGRGILYGDSAD